jgi:hypothetical protein
MGTLDEPGVIPRAVYGLFEAISAARHSNILIRVSYIEARAVETQERQPSCLPNPFL